MRKYLQIGTVVLLDGAEKRIMIIGYKCKDAKSEKDWDYVAVPYPEGMRASDNLILFDREQIDCLFFVGHLDAESLAFLGRLSDEGNNSNRQAGNPAS